MRNSNCKVLISSLLALVLLFSMLCVALTASAVSGTQIEFGSVSAQAGEEVKVPVTISNNSGLAAYRFKVSYDANALEFIKVENSETFAGGTIASSVNAQNQSVTFLWYSVTEVKTDGDIAYLTFKISDDADGDYDLTVKYLSEDILDEEKVILTCTVTNGMISVQEPTTVIITEPSTNEPTEDSSEVTEPVSTITEPTIVPEHKYLLGDANGDGKVNVKDATEIQKAVAGLLTLDENENTAADVDGSGNVNVKDATAIQKWVAGIDTGFKIGEIVEIQN